MDEMAEFAQWLKQKYGIDYPSPQLGAGQGFGMPGGGGGGGFSAGGAVGAAGKAVTPFNPAIGLGLQAGGFLLDALRGDPMAKYRKQGMKTAQEMVTTNPDVINVGGAIGRNRAAMIPRLGEMGEQFNKRFGLDTGTGQYANLQALLEKEGMFNLNASMENDRLKARQKQYYTGMLAGAGRR